ncbi:MAG: glycerate kinase [Alphaproteobacteria bacterium]|nr:glycerate kinase [Alphaproteobacteria bacterium]
MSWLGRLLGRRAPIDRVLYAPDSYGGFLSAPDAAERVAARMRQHGLTVVAWPMSDGGEGLIEVLRAHGPLRGEDVQVRDALARPRRAELAHKGGITVIETAEACGLRWLAPEERRALDTSTAGVADLLRAAAGRELRVGLGGSATVDGGLGMLQALGLRAEDAAGRVLEGPPARLLGRTARLVGEAAPLTGHAWHDVQTPLSACALRFGPQKGLPPDALDDHQAALVRFGDALAAWAADRGRALDPDAAGGGAAGGLGLALCALGLDLKPGAQAVAAWTGLRLDGVQAVVIGEGRLDATSADGKVATVVVAMARAAGLPVAALVGTATDAGAVLVDHVEAAGAPTLPAFLAATDRLARWLLPP